ncbi:MAG: hypothetical protein B6I26_08605 [Desulfobacteraceae bacterium 4572_130]|nr:MAG: hypothetical protein B6I26_08605 [Desulfobacteraceae bacterium 4572_130]
MTEKDKKNSIIELTDIVEQDSTNESKHEINKSFDLNDRVFKAAIEKIIKEKFAQKIEPIFFEIVEKVVKKEIAKVKKELLKKF